jgi:GMP synthase (glutamine-hydrolysing)
MRPLAVFVTGVPNPTVLGRLGSFPTMIRRTVGNAWTGAWVEVDCVGSELPDLSSLSGIVVTGSAAGVTERAPWMEKTAEALRQAVARELPVLGICFGHQLLGHALGGEVIPNPKGREIGTVPVELLVPDPLFGEPRTVLVQATHVDTVVTLPPGASVLGRSELEPHAAVRFAPDAWGVQFHPEFSRDLIRHYLQERRARLLEEGLDPDALASQAVETPQGAEFLRQFARRVANSSNDRSSGSTLGPAPSHTSVRSGKSVKRA